MGLQVLYPPQDAGKAEGIKADIVAVHGLNGDPKGTWTSRETSAFWLKDFLPQDVPYARVMTFGYNAEAAFGNTTADIIDHAKSLLSSLVDKREEDDELRRPIIFIGHSLGGIVIKQSLFQAKIEERYNSINESTVGIVFLGTPHRGSEKAVYGKILTTLATTVLNKPSPRLINALQLNSEALMRLTTEFRFQLPKYRVYSFYEMKPMKMLSTLVSNKLLSQWFQLDWRQVTMPKLLPPPGLEWLSGSRGRRSQWIYQCIAVLHCRARLIRTCVVFPPSSHPTRALATDKLFAGLFRVSSALPLHFLIEPQRGKLLGAVVVEKHSALLEIDGEEQIPVNANHEEMCKFMERQDDVYEKIFKRVRRMIKEQDSSPVYNASFYNKHYCIPRHLSAIFTGRDDIIQEMYKGFLATNAEITLIKQKRFVVYGLGGSGKTQACLKFAQDYRERFWGIFWIDASSNITANQGFLEISQMCGIDKDPKVVRQWLSNTQNNWLLIIDNADDPSIDVSNFFPTGNRGSILLTTRNPDCKIHSTVGSCELGKMTMDEAVTLLLRATGAEDTADEASRKKAIPVTQTIGFLALAIVQAGAYIRKGLCGLEEYCDMYTRCRKRLLEYAPEQMSSDYKYSVYTTWEISIAAIEKMCSETSRNAIELLRTFCFLHYDGIAENIFEQAWIKSYEIGDLPQDIAHMFYMQSQDEENHWDPLIIREAVVLLASFSLIKIDEIGHCMSMHPLVHVWARDRLSEELQKSFWVTSSSTLAATISLDRGLTEYRFRRSLLPHIKSCMSLCTDKPFLSEFSGLNRVDMAAAFAIAFLESGLLQVAMDLGEKVLEARQRTLGSEHPDTLGSMNNLAISYSYLGRTQEAMDLGEKVLKASQRMLGSEHPVTLTSMNNLAASYSDLGRMQEAMDLREKVLEASQRTLGSEHPDTLQALNNLA
ncbi:hypothetical protein MMC31_007963, partial [Peltigera leucophlebia]|nr:hypothetical protein [Peltigera leucophlebia]